jgi:2'-5' RNA ligase
LRYSVMLRPPPHIVAAMASDLERLREISPHHYYYPSDSMHVTIGGAGRFLNDGYRAATRFAELHAIIGSYPSFDITLRGLNVSPFTVFAQVIPHSRTLRGLRKEFRMLSRPLSRASAFGDYVQGLLPHVNIVRFSERVAPDFLNEVSRFREEWFGRWTVREVEVMRADRLLSSEGRQVLERIPLAPIHPTS